MQPTTAARSWGTTVLRLGPQEYIHVFDNSTCLRRLLCGPLTHTVEDNVIPLHGAPQKYVVIPPNHYSTIENPVVRDAATHEVVWDQHSGLPLQRVGDREIRLAQPPFPLFPGEVQLHAPLPLPMLGEDAAMIIHVDRDYVEHDSDGTVTCKRKAGEQWVFRGPGLYIPRAEESVGDALRPTIVQRGSVVEVMARVDLLDDDGVPRTAGEVWQIATPGAYFFHPNIVVHEIIRGIQLKPTEAVLVQAKEHFNDTALGVHRAPGDQWLVMGCDGERLFIRSRYESIVEKRDLIRVRHDQYCIIEDPVVNGVRRVGGRDLRRGPCSFFLQPGERVDGDVLRDMVVLESREALLIQARTSLVDEDGVAREISQRWLVRGPRSYIPPVEVEVIERRSAIALSAGEGVYVRNIKTGEVRAVREQAILLDEDHELWDKVVTPEVERLLASPHLALRNPQQQDARGSGTTNGKSPRKLHSVITCNIPHNSLVQLYDYKLDQSRVVQGPARVFLEPNEEFTVMSLSAGRPKQPDGISSLCLFLGPDFMVDVVEVETLDHTRLRLQLAYNWEFDMSDRERIKHIAFSVPDFVGEACKMLAGRIRTVISTETFESFHKNSSLIIRNAIFSNPHDASTQLINGALLFPVNGLLITNVDVHSVEPVDGNTRTALTNSVQLAVEIITKSQENEAMYKAADLEQSARGALELHMIHDTVAAEELRGRLLTVIAENMSIDAVGASKAQAEAESSAKIVEAETELEVTSTRCATLAATAGAELEIQKMRNDIDLDHRHARNVLAVNRLREKNKIQVAKLRTAMQAIGKETLAAIARAGPEMQVKLLSGLGLQGYLITDGSSPISLFNMAEKMIGTAPVPGQ